MLHTPRSYRGMVVSPHHLASRAGLNVLREGGNAVEAAVATSTALCAVYPHMTGLGGDGFWLIAEPGRQPLAIDACGRAAALATPELYRAAGLDAIPWRGPLAALTVAGGVSGWMAALDAAKSWGTPLPLSRLLEEGIYYAANGFAVTASQHGLSVAKLPGLAGQPGFAGQFLSGGQPFAEGSRLKLPALAETLARLARHGLDSFYRGDVARDLAGDLEAAGSPLRLADLAAHQAALVDPLRLTLPGVTLYNLPPPTQGLASLLILGIFAALRPGRAESFEHIHALVEATKQAFAVRDAVIGDPDAMRADPRAYLAPGAIAALAASVNPDRAGPWPSRQENAGDTVWYGVIDAKGRAVSAIQSIFFEFGSGVVLPATGVTWQNRGIAFALSGRGPRLLAPGRKPYHTLNPALATFDDGRVLAYGSMGGEGQPQTQAAVFSRYAFYGTPAQAAITAPRFVQGRTWGGETVSLQMEDRFDPGVVERLRAAGHEVKLVGAFDPIMGHAGAVARLAGGTLEGGADPRGDGAAACW